MGQSQPVRLLQTLDGSWSEWSDWSACSKSCLSQSDGLGEIHLVRSQCIALSTIIYNSSSALGVRRRSRRCDSPRPQNNGRQCLGELTETAQCSTELCEGTWGSWTPWTICSKSCGKGSRSRSRRCSDLQCRSDSSNFEIDDKCNDHECPSE